MADAITDQTRVIFIANPNNPTGTMVTKTETEKLMARVPDDILVVFDEAYYEYVDRPDYPQTLPYIHEGTQCHHHADLLQDLRTCRDADRIRASPNPILLKQ